MAAEGIPAGCMRRDDSSDMAAGAQRPGRRSCAASVYILNSAGSVALGHHWDTRSHSHYLIPREAPHLPGSDMAHSHLQMLAHVHSGEGIGPGIENKTESGSVPAVGSGQVKSGGCKGTTCFRPPLDLDETRNSHSAIAMAMRPKLPVCVRCSVCAGGAACQH